jgi:hypothetical protein
MGFVIRFIGVILICAVILYFWKPEIFRHIIEIFK